ncbi:hypothetical protein H7Y29_02565 [Microbacteriaceae bacterium]|nr:hypothetical protein [Candidatus Saccharibacteria bacterium]
MRPLFVPDWKKRYDFTERVFEEARTIMAKPEVIDALADKATFLTSIMEYVTPRPVQDSEIESHTDDNDNMIYAVSLGVGEQARIPSTKSNKFQHMAAAHIFGDEATRKFMIQGEIPAVLHMTPDIYGMCKAVAGCSEPDNLELGYPHLYVRGRPTIGLLYSAQAEPTSRALTLLHEIDHAANHMAYPIQFAKSDDELYLRSELSAYATQSAVARVLGITDARYVPHQIEDIRREFNGDVSSNEAYVARSEIVSCLSEKGLSHIYR